jgi:transcription termination factor NusB
MTEEFNAESLENQSDSTSADQATEQTAQGESENQEQSQESGEYSPNFQYKVFDKVKEFDDLLKPIVKDKNTEDKIRNLLSKADSMDPRRSESSVFSWRCTVAT